MERLLKASTVESVPPPGLCADSLIPLNITYMLKYSMSHLHIFSSVAFCPSLQLRSIISYYFKMKQQCGRFCCELKNHPATLYLQPTVLLPGCFESNNLKLPGSS